MSKKTKVVVSPLGADVGTDGVMSWEFENHMHVNKVTEDVLIDYWTGRIVCAIGQGGDAIRETVRKFFENTYDQVFDGAFDFGVEVTQNMGNVGKRKTRSMSKNTLRKTRSSVGKRTKISRKTKAAKRSRK